MDEPTLPHGEPYRPLGRRAQVVTILLIIGIGTTIAGVVPGLMERSLLDDLQQGQFITPQQADDNDRRQLLVAVVDGTVFTATGVFFLFWFHRAYRNLPALGGDRRYGTGWAIGSWFVPVLNAWRPKQIINDIWRESGPRTTDEFGTKDEGNKGAQPLPPLVDHVDPHGHALLDRDENELERGDGRRAPRGKRALPRRRHRQHRRGRARRRLRPAGDVA